MNFVVGHAVDAEDVTSGLFRFWAELIRRGRENDGHVYSSADYFEVMEAFDVSSAVRAWMDSIREDPLDDPTGFLVPSLRHSGWAVVEGEDGYRLTLAR